MSRTELFFLCLSPASGGEHESDQEERQDQDQRLDHCGGDAEAEEGPGDSQVVRDERRLAAPRVIGRLPLVADGGDGLVECSAAAPGSVDHCCSVDRRILGPEVDCGFCACIIGAVIESAAHRGGLHCLDEHSGLEG